MKSLSHPVILVLIARPRRRHSKIKQTAERWGRRVAEWLEHSTAKQKVAGSNPTRASGWKTPSVHPAVKWVPDLIQGRTGSGRRVIGSAFHMLCPRHSEPFAAPTATRLWDLYFFLERWFLSIIFLAYCINLYLTVFLPDNVLANLVSDGFQRIKRQPFTYTQHLLVTMNPLTNNTIISQ